MPPTTPDDAPMVPTAVLALVHVPPPPSLRDVVVPVHTVGVPEIADGPALTVIENVL